MTTIQTMKWSQKHSAWTGLHRYLEGMNGSSQITCCPTTEAVLTHLMVWPSSSGGCLQEISGFRTPHSASASWTATLDFERRPAQPVKQVCNSKPDESSQTILLHASQALNPNMLLAQASRLQKGFPTCGSKKRAIEGLISSAGKSPPSLSPRSVLLAANSYLSDNRICGRKRMRRIMKRVKLQDAREGFCLGHLEAPVGSNCLPEPQDT